ncbi:MAG: enoyl-CoA hydratase [Streptosporangiales bacterium]|nr:enoyl-CoA hydratase [Streptosporangiales bacterium]
MPLDLSVIGRENGPSQATWTSKDALLYALGVGAGQSDPLDELAFTTENSAGVNQQVLPVYGVVVANSHGPRPSFGDIDRTKLVHGEQAFTLHRPLPVEGSVTITSKVIGMFDKGSGALVVTESRLRDADTGQPLMDTRSSSFVRGEGGFGGEKQPKEEWAAPEDTPDHEATAEVRHDQALLYRLSGDRNPLHSDPDFAARGGFSKPILHGMCTYGITARLLIHGFCGGDASRQTSMSGRFTKPVLPGEKLTVRGWRDGSTVRFRTYDSAGDVALDRGTFGIREGS